MPPLSLGHVGVHEHGGLHVRTSVYYLPLAIANALGFPGFVWRSTHGDKGYAQRAVAETTSGSSSSLNNTIGPHMCHYLTESYLKPLCDLLSLAALAGNTLPYGPRRLSTQESRNPHSGPSFLQTGTMTSIVPELLAKKRKRDEQWAAERAAAAVDARKKARTTRKDIFKRAEKYVSEYRAQVKRAEAGRHRQKPLPGSAAPVGTTPAWNDGTISLSIIT